MYIAHHPKHYKYFPENFDREELDSMFNRQKMTYKEIGMAYGGISTKAIIKIMDELGFPRRKNGELNKIRMKGIPKSQEHREKHKKLLAEYNPMGNLSKTPNAIIKWKTTRHKRDNFKWSDEQKKRMSNYWLKYFAYNPDFLKKRSLSLNVRPNFSERQLFNIIEELGLPYKYVGDFQFWIAGKNPDFINTSGQNKVIECWGSHWHTEKEANERELLFQMHGYKTLFITDIELENPQSVKDKIVEFDKKEVSIWH